VLAMGQKHGLEAAARQAIETHPFTGQNHRESPPGANVLRNTITIDTAELQVRDVAAAAQLCFYTLRLYETGYLSPKGLTMSLARRALDRLDRQLDRFRS